MAKYAITIKHPGNFIYTTHYSAVNELYAVTLVWHNLMNGYPYNYPNSQILQIRYLGGVIMPEHGLGKFRDYQLASIGGTYVANKGANYIGPAKSVEELKTLITSTIDKPALLTILTRKKVDTEEEI